MDDTISRQEAIDTLLSISFIFSDELSEPEKEELAIATHEMMMTYVERIKSLPSKGEPKGKWIGEADGYADGEPVYDTWYCSVCDFMVETDGDKPTQNFCPNCGADMRGDTE